jgi:hypothetical protein
MNQLLTKELLKALHNKAFQVTAGGGFFESYENFETVLSSINLIGTQFPRFTRQHLN